MGFLCVLSYEVINSWDENKWSCKKDLRVFFMSCNWFLLWAIKSGARSIKNRKKSGNDAIKTEKGVLYMTFSDKTFEQWNLIIRKFS